MGDMLLFAILFCILMYFLYINGYMIINAKRAAVFIGSIRGKGTCGASFRSCSGYMKRIMRFRESRAYHFVLDAKLVSGEMEVEILDRDKKVILHLDEKSPEATIEADGKKRYTLIFRFKSATGEFKMRCFEGGYMLPENL